MYTSVPLSFRWTIPLTTVQAIAKAAVSHEFRMKVTFCRTIPLQVEQLKDRTE